MNRFWQSFATAQLLVLAVSKTSAAAEVATDEVSSGTQALPELVITAQRREERVQDTPVAVTAFGEEQLQRLNITRVRDLSGLVPGLYMPKTSNFGPNQQFSVRGLIELDTFFEPAVGVYVDGLPYTRSIGTNINYPDLARVEVLRGPQGTLYGRNVTAGAINFITKDPGQELEGQAQFQLGNHGDEEVNGFVSGPLVSDLLSASAAVSQRRRDGYTYDVSTGRFVNDVDNRYFRGKLRLTPGDALDIVLSADRSIDNSDPAYYTPINQPNGVPGGTGFDPNLTWVRTRLYSDFHMESQGLRASWKASDALTVRSITSHRTIGGPLYAGNDGGTSDITSESLLSYSQKLWTQELQALGRTGPVNFVVGAFFEDEKFVDNRVTLQSGTTPNLGPVTITNALVTTRSYSGYGQFDIDITGKLVATVGMRYTSDKRGIEASGYRTPNVPYPIVPLATLPIVASSVYAGQAEKTFSKFTPKLGLQYSFSPQLMSYATYSQGFRAGGFNQRAGNTAAAVTPYDAEKLNAYEIGVKSESFNRRLTANLALYYDAYKDIQVSGRDQVSGLQTRLNAAKATIKGVELETATLITERVRWTTNLSYVNFRYDEFTQALPSNPFNVTTLIGRAPVGTPRWNLGSALSIDLPIRLPGLFQLSGDVRYTTKSYPDIYNTEILRTPPETFVNAALSYTTENGRITMTARVENLTNVQENQEGTYNPTIGPNGRLTWLFNPPRMYTFGVQVKF